ncbi:MAG: hypothetical protein KC449_23085 [Anaerolineales bacterium]|nr:hypothetical protein [Anaerolineales bacterium]
MRDITPIWKPAAGLPDGTRLEVGTVQTAATVGTALSGQWAGIQFAQNFAVAPVVVSQVQTDNDPHWVVNIG